MRLTFAGAAQEVTGSCHLLEVENQTLMLDCGLFQGRRSETRLKNRQLPIAVDRVSAVVLSHAHIDHAGRLPFLVGEGFGGRIYATPATRDLSSVMLADSAYIQEQDARFLAKRNRQFVEPLYTVKDAVSTIEQMVCHPYGMTFDPAPGVRASFADAGHIIGSASVTLDCTEGGRTRRVLFSGDVGRPGLPIIRDPVAPAGASVLIMESTYGDRDHELVPRARERFAEIVRDTAARGGRVLIPAFAVGRTQELLYDLHGLLREGAIPPIPVYVDSPMAIDATSVFAMHPDVFDRTETLIRDVSELFDFPSVHFTRTVEQSKSLNEMRGPLIIIAASGMAETGRILHHLLRGAEDPRNTILIVGFQAEHTLGRRIVERKPTLRIFGEDVSLRARVEVINGYSAHADRGELLAWVRSVRERSPELREIFLVHGEPKAQEPLAGVLRAEGFRVECPARGQTYEL